MPESFFKKKVFNPTIFNERTTLNAAHGQVKGKDIRVLISPSDFHITIPNPQEGPVVSVEERCLYNVLIYRWGESHSREYSNLKKEHPTHQIQLYGNELLIALNHYLDQLNRNTKPRTLQKYKSHNFIHSK